jgi:hypothetical protein
MKPGVRNLQFLALIFALFGLLALGASLAYSQTATSGAVAGTVTDPTGAVVSGATVTLVQEGTNATQTATTDSGGRYTFPRVAPGEYTLTIFAKGFRKTSVNKLAVEVAKSATVDQTLTVGATTDVVEVTASTMNELQTTDSSVGEVLSGQELNRLPVQGRSAAQLIFYQPGVAPDVGASTGDEGGGQIAGARSDQISFTVDGGDATSDFEGSNNYASPSQESTAVSPVVPISQDSVAEFRVSTNNSNATFGASSGGQVSVITKSGTNTIHGGLYEYHADNGLNANGWTNDHYGVPKPAQVDNRFGVGMGGPIIKDKFFYYGFYEGRRFHDKTLIDRIVPTDSLKSGIIQWPDASGVYHSANFNPANGPLAAVCGPSGTGACDPRGLGVSSVVMAQLALLPTGNNPSEGDGVNTMGLTLPVATPVSTNQSKLKLNYIINNKWSAFATWQYSSTSRTGAEQISLLGSKPISVAGDPYFANFFTFQLQGQLSPTFLSVTHGSFLRNWWGWTRKAPSPLVSGTDYALQIAGEDGGGESTFSGTGKLLADPINLDTQEARPRVWDGHDWYIGQDFTKVIGPHQFQFGGDIRIWNDYHFRTDDVYGGLTTAPLTYVGSSNLYQNAYATVGSANEPLGLAASDVDFWDGYYASILGIVDHSAQVETRNGSFQPYPLGTATNIHATLPMYNFYFQDIFKARRNLTITAGVNWGVVPSPDIKNGLASVMVYANSNTPMNELQFLKTRGAALEAGQNYNPLLGISPINSLAPPFNGKMRQSYWKNIGPRLAAAWQVKPNTVIRGGYALVWDRATAVSSVLWGVLSGGLLDIDKCAGPTFNASGTAVCSGLPTNPSTAYRIGPDGASVPLPPPVANPIPLVPSLSSLTYSFGGDAYLTPGYAHVIDLTVQRTLPHNMLLEVGYIGRFGRNLIQDQQINAPDYRQKEPQSGQTYGQAMDALDKAFLAGATSVAPQPFFENLGAGANCMAIFGTNCSNAAFALIPSVGPADLGFLDYLMNLYGLFTVPTSNNQIEEDAPQTDGGYTNYNAMVVTLRSPKTHGLQFQANYTWSHAIGTQGYNQHDITSNESPYNYHLDKAAEPYDHRQVLSALWYYDLPFGKGKTFSTTSNLLDRFIGGWSWSGIFNYYTGVPDCPLDSAGNYGSFFVSACAVPSASLPSMGKHNNVTGASGIATDGTINAFSNPVAVYNSLQYPQLSVNNRVPHDDLYSFSYWNFDMSFGKKIPITERVGLSVSADAFNIFNHVTFNAPSLDLLNPAGFGVITSQYVPGISLTGARVMQLGVRLEF